MKELQVFEFSGQHVVDSREVAEMIEKNHAHLLRDIKGYIEVLGKSNFGLANFFIEHSYTDAQGKPRLCYLLTRKGCDMVANKMTGEKGVLFTAAYVTKFEQMEEFIKKGQQKQFTAREQLLLIMKASEETAQRVDAIESEVSNVKSDVQELRENLVITSAQAKALRYKAHEKVSEALGGKDSHAYKKMRNKTYSACWREFWNYFNINEYRELPKTKFEEGMKFLLSWQPSTTLRMEIEQCNTQIEMNLN